MFKNKSGKFMLWVSLSMLMLSVVSGFFMAKATASPLKEEDAEAIGKDCEVIHKYNYTLCGKSETVSEKSDANIVGLTKDELEDVLESGRVTNFASDSITITHDIRQYCSEHYILVIENGEIVIKQNTDITPELETIFTMGEPQTPLKTSVKARLEKGIVFSKLNEAKEYALTDIYK